MCIPPPYLFSYIKSISLHPLLWMNVMLHFICIDYAELWATGNKRKIKNENMPPPGIELATACFQVYRSNHSATLSVIDLLLNQRPSRSLECCWPFSKNMNSGAFVITIATIELPQSAYMYNKTFGSTCKTVIFWTYSSVLLITKKEYHKQVGTACCLQGKGSYE